MNQALEKGLRSQLENTVKDAREIAEDAASIALEQLGVGKPEAYSYLTESQKGLRRRLRIHGRQLGDKLLSDKRQETELLIEEVAYEHWHRMLFARFLAENDLLMYPDPVRPIAVSLEECEDMAKEEGTANGWELASRYASLMLPQIFRIDSPVFSLILPPEHQSKLENALTSLPADVFLAFDSLGWVYQYWQGRNKDLVNLSEVKIGARELPAVTQLFTESYMVSYLLDNSVGAWWATQFLNENDFKNAESEDELRKKASIPGVPLEYLRFLKNKDGLWEPAAGTFDDWPKKIKELKALDPCCGSGHFLVSLFLMLVPMRMILEELTPQDSVNAVLNDNIYGLELDKRCVELAVFALALEAWKYPSAGGYRLLPELNIACTGLTVSSNFDEWVELAEDDNTLRLGLEKLFYQFRDAPFLGSLINPETSLDKGSLFELHWEEVSKLVNKVLANKKDETRNEIGVVAKGLARAAILLSGKYNIVMTNVPYLALGRFSETLRTFCEIHHHSARHDLATCFIERCLDFCCIGGSSILVLPQNWIFLKRYSAFRESLLKKYSWVVVSKLGANAFEEISGEVVSVCLSIFNNVLPTDKSSVNAFEAENTQGIGNKRLYLKEGMHANFNQLSQLNNENTVIRFQELGSVDLLSKFCSALSGVSTGELNQFLRKFWEISKLNWQWEFSQTSVSKQGFYEGLTNIIFWEEERGNLYNHAQSVKHLNHAAQNWLRGKPNWGKKGVSLSKMSDLKGAIYSGEIYDENCCALIPNDERDLPLLWSFCESGQYTKEVRKINKSLLVQTKYMINVPFDADLWGKVAKQNYPSGLPKPYSNNPTQWIFHGHPCGSVIWDVDIKWTRHGPVRIDETVLQVGVARLLGYQWPANSDEEMELAEEQREWVNRAIDLTKYADEDGIVCVPSVRGEAAAADRLMELLVAAYGDDWNNDILGKLLDSANHSGKSLENWIRDKFFTQHCKMFHHRPFVWHIWDGLTDGFAALLNYHKLDYKNLETLIYTYLGDWISKQKRDIEDGIDGAEEKLVAAVVLKKRLELILEGEDPYDIFVRWKPLEEQPLGWNPDLNDGVRMNIRPFMSVPDIRKKGAGVFRDKPNIKWDKDRGKDVSSAPLFHLFNGDRINNHHLSLIQKKESRQND